MLLLSFAIQPIPQESISVIRRMDLVVVLVIVAIITAARSSSRVLGTNQRIVVTNPEGTVFLSQELIN